MNNLELNLNLITVNNPFLTAVLGVFNAKSNLWYNHDITISEGSKIDGVTSQYRLQQIIKETAHITGNASPVKT